MGKRIDSFRKIVEGNQMHAPISELLNMPLTYIEEGKAIFELDVQPKFLNSNGVIQGGILCSLAAAAMGLAFGSLLDDEQDFAGIEFKINYFRPVTQGHLKAIGIVRHYTKRTGYTECEIFNEEEKLVAKVVGTNMITNA